MDRLKQFQKHLGAESDNESEHKIVTKQVSKYRELSIGGVTVRVGDPQRYELVPMINDPFLTETQEILRHFRWIMQKDALGQDMFLLGPPGPLKRNIIQKYAQLANREIEYVALSKDMTDGDLKQRREIRSGTAFYTDQASVRAAIHGRILVLDGIEKAERNVLPIINNLLENREMALDDGRFLVHPKRFDSLAGNESSEEMRKWKLVRTSEKFVVVALGLPVPVEYIKTMKYEGHPLDPPLRSRFQARNINIPSYLSQVMRLSKIAPNVPSKILERLISVGTVLRSETTTANSSVSIPEFPSSLDFVARILNAIPACSPRALLDCIYPYILIEDVLEKEEKSLIETAYQRFDFGNFSPNSWLDSGFRVTDIQNDNMGKSNVRFTPVLKTTVANSHLVHVNSGILDSAEPEFFVKTEYHSSLLASVVLAHSVSDICIVGEKGVGKSALLRAAVRMLGYRTEYIPLYKDMSARDLLQRRSTNLQGDTIWESSALIKAAIEGSVAVLDQIEVAAEGVLSSIQSLIAEREVSLPDGTLLINPTRYEKLCKVITADEMWSRKILKVHESFRIIALARPKSQPTSRGTWLTPEILNLFMFVPMRTLSYDEEYNVIQSICPAIEEKLLNSLLGFANKLRLQKDESLRSLAAAMSTRQLIRCVRRLSLFPEDSLYDIILKAQLSQFLPSLTKESLERILFQSKIFKQSAASNSQEFKAEILLERGIEVLRIGNVCHPVSIDSNKLLIPDIVFYDNPKQTLILKEMLKDFILGEHILLIGNQGVGKNKLVDKLLQLLKLPREYIQLHRDTTIHSLTSTPTIVDGVLVYEDSPLVRAAKEGYILVVDEADKAPTHVTSVLKSLVEDGEMVLSDGRRLLYRNPVLQSENIIEVHKNFRMFVLANRPGFPFLGNDFYGEIGDIFATHCVGNPDKISELYMLKKYAPSVDEDILIKLIDSFNDLRHLVDEGLINYPYSTRELVSVVKHLENYRKEGLSRALGNVFDFDSYDNEVKELIITTLAKNGVHVGIQSDFTVELGAVVQLPNSELIETWIPATQKTLETCKVENLRFQLLGGWVLNFRDNFFGSDDSKTSNILQRINVRSSVFTEQIYAFKIPCNGDVLDACRPMGESNLFYALATNPITLYCIDGDHRKMQTLDLYEFFPLQKILGIHVVDTEGSTTLILQHLDQSTKMLQDSFLICDGVSWLLKALVVERTGIFSSNIEISEISSTRFDRFDYPISSQALNLATPFYSFGSFVKGLPETTTNRHESTASINHWPRKPRQGEDLVGNRFVNISNGYLYLTKSKQIATIIPWDNGKQEGVLEIVDPAANTVRSIRIPLLIPAYASSKPDQSWVTSIKSRRIISMVELTNGNLLTIDLTGMARVWQISSTEIASEMHEWRRLVGSLEISDLKIRYLGDFENNVYVDVEKSDELDGEENGNGFGKGEGQGEGGTGVGASGSGGQGEGGDASGLGVGSGGEPAADGRQSGTVDLSSFALRTANDIPKSVSDAQKVLHEMALKKRLEQLLMSEKDMKNISREIRELRAIIETTETKDKERVWLRNQSTGDVDDSKLIEGVTGERAIYKRRGEDTSVFQQKPKKLFLSFDLSASMMRFNGLDARLDRSLECALLIMESFKSFEHKFQYRISGHSGDGPNAEFVLERKYPKNEKDMFGILNKMSNHAKFCISGDTTIAAVETAIKEIAKEEADDYFVLILSDANITQYNIRPEELEKGESHLSAK
ncbi:von Willebrand factor A domain-containing protein 8 [Physocladia obscura]|uniref:von Willebrand factor A domain-containing protein 8 n=1 Tax=Physocladia obscura TaxID=109957 RepID=A0AAD5XIV5_9FUNG|nr:von Willebrand factor A domain-containing protein 8 [Physocladia obscura]